MNGFYRLNRDLAAALFGVLLLFFAFGVQAQTVTNTAHARWTDAGSLRTASSNTVELNVIPDTVILETLQALPGSGTVSATAAHCGGLALPISGTRSSSGIASLARTTTLIAGERLYFRLVAPRSNRDPAVIDSITTTLVTSNGDREVLTVFETTPDSGVFIGAIPTTATPPVAVHGDCRLSVAPGDTVLVECRNGNEPRPIAVTRVAILADPFGLIFDSEDGSPVDGATVSMVDALTGAPARVFADDGVTPWPATVVSGQQVIDGAGNFYSFLPGEYRFPLAPLGQYRIVVGPPSPYTAPSGASAAQIASLTRPDGGPLLIVPGSYGGVITLASPAPVRVDIPVDRPGVAVSLTKSASRASAAPGDAVFYTIRATNSDPSRAKRQVVLSDVPSKWLRLRKDSIRVDGAPAPGAVSVAADGRTITIALGDVAAAATRVVTYAMAVRADAPPGQALNRAEATDSRGLKSVASAVLRIERETIAGRMTIIGRIVDGACGVAGPHQGIPGVRVMLEDGSFVLTDAEGRYHFEGIVPGTHVVQAAQETLPNSGTFVDCVRATRNAGKANSRFVTGQGGSLVQVDFTATLPEIQTASLSEKKELISVREAAGGEVDWLAQGDGPTEFLFPAPDHNPRAPAVRVAIRHRQGQAVELFADGKPVDPIAFDGAKASSSGYAVSVWRGIPLSGESTRLTATVRNANGDVSDALTRDVHFAATPARVELVRERSRLVADGASRPVLAVRVVDRLGRPVHAGLTGGFQINAPYESAAQLDAMQTRQLSGLDRAAPSWTIKGDDGIALVELAPTMVSGPLKLDFAFADDQVTRKQTLDAWIIPGAQKWTLVGLAEGTAGARSVASQMERKGRFDSDLGKDARVAFYAKGKVLGRALLTVAYDSAKQKDDQRLLGAIDPNAYYTVFADAADRRFDAASREKLYIRIEAATFYALYGDIVTGFDQTQLARYQRSLTGTKAEGQFGALHVQGFAAKTSDLHRRDEIQGGGISGPYRLSSRDPIANSETVTIEVRDRFRSELVVASRNLNRFIDYDIDLLSGTISFKEPILSRDVDLNPQFIVIDYEIDRARGGKLNAGLRGDATMLGGKVRVGASAISDTASAGGQRASLGAADIKVRLAADTELRAEAALSRTAGNTSEAWLVELEHHDGRLDLLGYIRSVGDDFGLGQINGAERGRRKVGIDGRYRFDEALSLIASAWYDDSLTDTTRRHAIELNGLYRTQTTDFRVGIAHFADRLQDGERGGSTVLEAAATRRMLDNKLELTGAASIALGKAESLDLPSRYRIGLRYALTPAIKLTGTYEIAQGEAIKARTARAGVELSPWDGARVLGSLGRQDIAENGKRSFAAFGLSQSVQVSKQITLDATLDSARTLGRFDASRLVNPDHPASSGGLVGEAGTLAEDFTALTLGGTWRREQWTAIARGEYRDGAFADRTGVTFGAIRQIGEGSAVGGGFSWTRAEGEGGTTSEVFDGAISAAYRPGNSPLAVLTKLEFRSDSIASAVAGEAGPAGRTALTIDGDAKARRLIGSVSANWSPKEEDDGQRVQRHEIGLFAAVRHSFDRYEGFDLRGTSLFGGLDARIGVGKRIEIGGTVTVRHSLSDHTTLFAIGPQVGVSPTDDVLLTVGYNLSGFRDRDFAATRSTEKGLFASVKLKFDADTLGFLGLGRR